MDIVVALLVVGLVGLWVRRSTAEAVELRRLRESYAAWCSVAASDRGNGLDGERMWARPPLVPEGGWKVTRVPWPVRPGDRLPVRRRDGSESLATVKRVVLEFHEPDGAVVGHLVEVEGA